MFIHCRTIETSLEECRKRKDQAKKLEVQYQADLVQAKEEHAKVKQIFERISRIMVCVS